MTFRPNLEISTVVGCRMRCSYCPQTLHMTKYAETNHSDAFRMSLATFKCCLDKVPKNVDIVFAGMAEPWLNKGATEMILHAHALGYRLHVYTTTVGMTVKDINYIKDIPFAGFCLHLPDAEGRMKCDVTPAYLEVLGHCFREIPNTTMVIGPLHPDVRKVIGRDVPDGTSSLYSRAGLLSGFDIPRKTGKIKCSSCGPDIDHNVMLPNGDVILCCMTYDMKHVLGNLLHNTYESLFLSEEYLKVKRGLDGDESIDIACRTCEVSVPA